MSDILTAFYSWSGNTRRIAELIRKETGCDIFEITPAVPYPGDYNLTVKQARQEIQRGYKPALAGLPDISGYACIFIGTPNWWSTMAPPVASFMEGLDFAGKRVIPFSTHGGGGEASCALDISRLAVGASVLKSFCVYGDGGAGAASSAAKWLRSIGF